MSSEPKQKSDSLQDFCASLSERHERGTHLPTGYSSLDGLLGGGIQVGKLTILGTDRPYKDSLAESLAAGIVLHTLRTNKGVYSVGGRDELFPRFLCYCGIEGRSSRLDARKIQNGILRDSDWPKLCMTAGHLSGMEWNLTTDQRAPVSAGTLNEAIIPLLNPWDGLLVVFGGFTRLIPTQPWLDFGDDPTGLRLKMHLAEELKSLSKGCRIATILVIPSEEHLTLANRPLMELADFVVTISRRKLRGRYATTYAAKNPITVKSPLGTGHLALTYAPKRMMFVEKTRIRWPSPNPLNTN